MKLFKKLFAALVVFSIKLISKIFYKTEAIWLTPKDQIQWDQLRLGVVLNHTSLYEPLFISAFPNYRLWRAIDRVVAPVADVTLARPIVGRFFKVIVPNVIGITRKRDDSWDMVMSQVKGNSLLVIFPEGRMKRKDGLDKHGKPMSVKGGVADILEKLDSGKMLIAYSGGLHHVQAPGDLVPKLFQTIRVTFEQLDIQEYKNAIRSGSTDFKAGVIRDLESRMKQYC